MSALGNATEAGRLSIRVLPDTRKFPRDLRQKLNRIEKSMHFTVNVDRARVHRKKLRDTIARQMKQLGDFEITVDGKLGRLQKQLDDMKDRFKLVPELDRRTLMRLIRTVEDSFDDIEPTISPDVDGDRARRGMNRLMDEFKRLEKNFEITVLSEEEMTRTRARMAELEEKLRHFKEYGDVEIFDDEEYWRTMRRIHQLGDELDDATDDRTVRVDINPFTAWASARLAWLTRPRFVEVIPRISQTALLKVTTALAALSGARLTWDYFDRFQEWMSEVDKKLPRLTFGVTGLTTAFSALMASVSGIVGIGDGLAATTHSLLLLPGLFAGAVMSGISLYVALKDAKEQLDELGDSYQNLGRIISRTFWNEARQPIIEFSNSIMPQLERSFEKTSRAIGRFTAQLMQDFQREFANGRLEAMFDGLAAGWDELSKGTAAFARAITNLGLVAARYMPRLAAWFVRQADTFDNWLADVAADGRLAAWIEESIEAFYALWDVMAATTGIFQALWKAASDAGSGGLRGFADMLLAWERAIQGQRWQETLVAFFRGAGEAMRGLGDGIERFGIMLHGLRDDIEYFMGRAGRIIGDFIGDVADALNSPKVGKGLRDFIDGIGDGLDGLDDALGPMSDLFARLLSFIGELAREIGPVLGKAFEVLAPHVERVLEAIEPLIPQLGEALIDVIEQLAPYIEDLVDWFVEAAPAIGDFAEKVIRAAPSLLLLAAGFSALFMAARPVIGLLADREKLGLIKDLVDNLKKFAPAIMRVAGPIGLVAGAVTTLWTQSETFRDSVKKIWDSISDLVGAVKELVDTLVKPLVDALGVEGVGGAFDLFIQTAIGPLEHALEGITPIVEGVIDAFTKMVEAVTAAAQGDWDTAFDKLIEGAEEMLGIFPDLAEGFRNILPPQAQEDMDNFWRDATNAFEAFKLNFTTGLDVIQTELQELFEDPEAWFEEDGRLLLQGLITGLTEGMEAVATWFEDLRAGFEEKAAEVITGFMTGLESAMPNLGAWMVNFPVRILLFLLDATIWLLQTGKDTIQGFNNGLIEKWEDIKRWFLSIPGKIESFFNGAPTWLQTEGRDVLQGFRNGAVHAWNSAVAWVRSIPSQVISIFAGAGGWLVESGRALLRGFAEGVESQVAAAKAAIRNRLEEIRALFPNSPAKEGPFSGRGWVSYSGEAVGDTFGASLAEALERSRTRIANSLGGIRGEFTSLSSDVSDMQLGVSSQFKASRSYATASQASAMRASHSFALNVYDVDNRLIGAMDARVARGTQAVSVGELRSDLGRM